MAKRGTAPHRPGSALVNISVLGLALVGIFARRDRLPATAAGGTVPPRDEGRTADAGQARSPLGQGSDPGGAPAIEHRPGVIGIGRAIVDRIGRDNITLVAAGVAFYVLLALFPALAAMVSLYALVGNPADVAARISDYGGLLPPAALKLITDGLNSFAQKSGSQLSLALITGLLLALWSARAGISSVMTGLNIAYEETEKRSFIMQNVVALAMTLAGVVFSVLIILAVAVVPAVLAFVHLDSLAAQLVAIARWPILALIVVLGFAVMYRYAPSRSHPRWRWITWGSGIATVLWMIGSFAFSIYVSKFGSYDAMYGSLGAVVVMLLWFWVSALVLLLGAEIDSELDKRDAEGGHPLAGLAPGSGPPR